MWISLFLSAVTDEFRAYRDQLNHDLTRHNVAVKVQEDFKDLGSDMLDTLDEYIAHCSVVVHLVGDMCGASASGRQQRALIAKYRDLQGKLPPLGEALEAGATLPYTHWEAWLALYHDKKLTITKAGEAAPRGPNYAPTEASRAAQADHLVRLKAYDRYPGPRLFESPDNLANIIWSSILDLLGEGYAKRVERERDVAVRFIREIAIRFDAPALELDDMMQTVRSALEIQEKKIASGSAPPEFDKIVNSALGRTSEGLFRAAEEMQQREKERRERYIATQTALYHRARDMAFAAYNPDLAADAVIRLARAVDGGHVAAINTFLNEEAGSLYEYGRGHGGHVHLAAAIALRREIVQLANSADERDDAASRLGFALSTVGERETGTARRQEAITAFWSAIEEVVLSARTPSLWAKTQNNLDITYKWLRAWGDLIDFT